MKKSIQIPKQKLQYPHKMTHNKSTGTFPNDKCHQLFNINQTFPNDKYIQIKTTKQPA